MNILKTGMAASLVLLSFEASTQADTSKLPKESVITSGGLSEAVFPGGNGAWYKYLSQNLNTYIARDKGPPRGSYTVKVEFWIDKTGEIMKIKALTNLGFGIEEEMIRVINQSPLWTPAKQRGRLVRMKMSQLITFNAEK
jgi:Gram-negative bacterial TonB protein C-terminal